jgi:transposase
MKTKNNNLKKVIMWYKVNELKGNGLNKSQISYELGIDRSTVRKYLSMSKEEFHEWLENTRELPKKLREYYDCVKKLLENHNYFSASQVEDRLKEEYADLPVVHSKTVYNFVQSIRLAHGIKKHKDHPPREYEKLPELAYGQQAQADFGQYWMQTENGGRKKVYFFVMVLSRSRQKYTYFQVAPFTTESTILAHGKAFEYFGGQTREVVYDQDRVLIVEENLGYIMATREFGLYIQEMDFTPVFCHKSDPESKGKVENVVGFIKKNFLRGRIFKGEDNLNESALGWLKRTGNGKEHAGIKKIPSHEWEIERGHLLPLKPKTYKIEQEDKKKYKVRKDNTISYKSNFYSLPLGTYQGSESWVLLEEENEEIKIYSLQQSLLTTHTLCHQRGVTIHNTDHRRDKSQSISILKASILEKLPNDKKVILYIDQVHKAKPRYIRDSLLVIEKHLPELGQEYILRAIGFCLENNIYNSNRLIEIARHYKKEQDGQSTIKIEIPEIKTNCNYELLEITPQTSKINVYQNLM